VFLLLSEANFGMARSIIVGVLMIIIIKTKKNKKVLLENWSLKNFGME